LKYWNIEVSCGSRRFNVPLRYRGSRQTGVFGWMMKKSTCKALENELNNLKRLLEEGAGQAG
jgi:hypothetical protein